MTQDLAAQDARALHQRADTTLEALDGILDGVCTELADTWKVRSPEPVDVLDADLPELLRSRLLPGAGKRVRPTMVHWGWVSAHGARDRRAHEVVARVGAALELLHLFALVHDDVMDRSETRRGGATVHAQAREAHKRSRGLGDAVAFGDGIAVLLGDLALSEASVLVAGAPREVQGLWQEMLRELVHGQTLDLTAAAARRRDLAMARRIGRLKSGGYTIHRPLLIGAAIAGAPPAVRDALSTYGEHLGEAFAMRDDLLAVTGNPALTGKPVGDDLVAGKATVAIAAARRLLPDAVSRRYFGPDGSVAPEDVPTLQQLFVDWGVLDEIEERIDDEASSALESLECEHLHPAGVAGLTEMVKVVAWRET